MKSIATLPSGVQVLKKFTKLKMSLELRYYNGEYTICFSDSKLRTKNGNRRQPISYNLARYIYYKHL